jgi:alkylation response protein AidB-like acyl-CoA dehydrogenase
VLQFSRKEIAPLSEAWDLRGEFCWEAWRKLGAFGLLGLHFPEEYGGSGSDVTTACVAGEALAEGGGDGGLTLSWGAHTYLCGDTILQHGTPAQKARYLPRLATGEWVGALGLTEPDAGSDASAVRTTAVRKGDGFVLNGTKMFITNGPIADVLIVIASTDKEKKAGGVTAFIVEKDCPGFRPGQPLKKMGCRASPTSELVFEECRVPAENRLGAEGEGFMRIALGALEWDRSALMAPFVGGMRYVLDACVAYAQQRVQFDRPIARFQAIQHKLADMKVTYEASRLLVYRVAWCKDQGRPLNHLEAATAKLFVAEAGMKLAHDAVQIHGGYGYIHEYPVERVYRNARLASIGGGTSEIQRAIVARMIMSLDYSQGRAI